MNTVTCNLALVLRLKASKAQEFVIYQLINKKRKLSYWKRGYLSSFYTLDFMTFSFPSRAKRTNKYYFFYFVRQGRAD